MDDIFDFEELKKKVDSVGKPDVNEIFELESILRDFGTDVSSDIEPDKAETENIIKQCEAIPEFTLEREDDIKKPVAVSITGIFEAVRSEKTSTVTEEPILSDIKMCVVDEEITEDMPDEAELPQSQEIADEIEHARFFNTETFESIKEDSHVKAENPIASFRTINDRPKKRL